MTSESQLIAERQTGIGGTDAAAILGLARCNDLLLSYLAVYNAEQGQTGSQQ